MGRVLWRNENACLPRGGGSDNGRSRANNGLTMTAADLTTPTTGVLEELRAALPAGALLTDAAGLFVYESDGFTIARARPRAVVFATNLREVVRVVETLARHDVQIVPRGSGTGLAGGCVAFDDGIIVSTTRM